jgi:hypothetical protein
MLEWLSFLWLWKVQSSNQNLLCHILFWPSQRSFAIVENNFFCELNMFFYQNSFDVDGDYGGTHNSMSYA